MDKYEVFLAPQAYRDIDEIYRYIGGELQAENAAENTADKIESAILSLNSMPYRGAERKVGQYAGKGYRQLFVNNYIIVYRIEEPTHSVIIITVKYVRQNF